MKPCNEFEIVGLDATYRKYYLKGYEDAEKEHNYHLKKIIAEIDAHREKLKIMADDDWYAGKIRGFDCAIEIIEKYRGDKE